MNWCVINDIIKQNNLSKPLISSVIYTPTPQPHKNVFFIQKKRIFIFSVLGENLFNGCK